MWTIYLDNYPMEYCFNQAQLADAMSYWQAFGEIEIKPSPNEYVLY